MDITIKLKAGLRWSDGQPLTTGDVHFTFDAVCPTWSPFSERK